MRQTFFIDIGNVLLLYSHEKMIEQLSMLFQMSHKTISRLLFQDGLGSKYELGEISTQDLFNLSLKHSLANPSLLDFETALSDIFVPNWDTIALLRHVKEKGHRLVILSNTCEAHYKYMIANYPFFQLFDDRLLSFELKIAKPTPKIYEKALQKSQGPSFYTDDLHENILSAQKAGLDSELFINAQTLEKHLNERGFI